MQLDTVHDIRTYESAVILLEGGVKVDLTKYIYVYAYVINNSTVFIINTVLCNDVFVTCNLPVVSLYSRCLEFL